MLKIGQLNRTGPARAGMWAAVVVVSALAAASSASPQRAPVGTITLRASVIDIDAGGITATGSPVLTSSQGTVVAKQFSVELDKQGRASVAKATGGVRFNLAAPNVAHSSYQNVVSTCS